MATWLRPSSTPRGPEEGLETARFAAQHLDRPGDVVLIKYALALSVNGHNDLARDELLAILPRNQSDAEIHCQIARTYDFQERIGEAAVWYRKAIELDRDHIGIAGLELSHARQVLHAAIGVEAGDHELHFLAHVASGLKFAV